jgi:6-pyruvoyltetrahydropterin/6-carboxytetrahydropterin synthase
MSKLQITKKINFVAGHRVHSQNLPKSLGPNKCRHLHGQEYVLEVFASRDLQSDGMVMDFTFFNHLNNFIQKHLDHKFILDINDPLFDMITGTSLSDAKLLYYTVDKTDEYLKITNQNNALFAKFSKFHPDNRNEFRESFVLVNFIPTAENLARWFIDVIERFKEVNIFPADLQVSKVRLYETQKAYVELDL